MDSQDPPSITAKRRRSRIGRWRDSLAKSGAEQEAEDARADAERVEATRIEELLDRQMAQVAGVVRSVTLPPRASVPMLVVELFDGTRAMTLVWFGRRSIGGIEPGALLSASGRVSMRRGVPVIFNPAYAIIPRG
ncbi:MAG: OB-fold nucleic acid binding domain-containing protein [Nostocoides sp.]